MKHLLVLLSVFFLGCGASAYSTHATIGSVLSIGVAQSALLLPHAQDVALSSCSDLLCVEQTAVAVRAASSSLELLSIAVRAYVDAVRTAVLVDDGQMMDALRLALRAIITAWNSTRLALESLHVELPAIPPMALTLVEAL